MSDSGSRRRLKHPLLLVLTMEDIFPQKRRLKAKADAAIARYGKHIVSRISKSSFPNARNRGPTLAINTSSASVFSDGTLVESPVSDNGTPPLRGPVEKVLAVLDSEGVKGQLICITPRQGANGRYERPVGRRTQSDDMCTMGVNPPNNSGDTINSISTSIGVDAGTNTAPSTAVSRPLRSGTFRSSDDNLLRYRRKDDWVAHVAPDGKTFFLKDDGDVTFITDTHIRRTEFFEDIEKWRKILRRVIDAQRHDRTIDCPADWEVYLNVEEKGGSCYYYMIDHDSGQVFWAHEVDKSHLNLPEDITEVGLKLFFQTEYWQHLEYFSHALPLYAEAKLRGMLLYAHVDSVTAPGSTVSYSPEECLQFLNILDKVSTLPTEPAAKNHVIARLLKTFSHNQCLTLYGEEGARLDRAQRSHEATANSTRLRVQIFLLLLSATVFRTDMRQLEKIEEIVVDDIVLPRLWKPFIMHILRTAEQSNVVAAIILASNVGFLAINDLTPLQYSANLISSLFSLSSLLIGLHHLRQHGSLVDSDAHDGATYLKNAFLPSWGEYRLLAFFHCLPFALLIWSILTFCFTIGLLAYGLIANSIGFVGFLVAGSVQLCLLVVTVRFFWRLWEPEGEEKKYPWLAEVYTSVKDKVNHFQVVIHNPAVQTTVQPMVPLPAHGVNNI